MLRNKSTFKLIGLFAVAVFAFALGFASVTPVVAGEDQCCTIVREGCQDGLGVWGYVDPWTKDCIIDLSSSCPMLPPNCY